MFLCILSMILWSPNVKLQLSHPTVQSFNGWQLRFDDHSTKPFSNEGSLEIDNTTMVGFFEILNPANKVTFLGHWARFEGKKTINIAIGEQSMNVYEVVTADRYQSSSWEVPAEIEVIDISGEATRSEAQTSGWLEDQAEILVQKTNLGGGSPVIRGMSGNRVLLLVDGFRLNNATFRLGLNQYLNTVPSSQLEQIEVMLGPTGVQYGSDGLGGTVHLRSRDILSDASRLLSYGGFFSSADQTNTHTISGHQSNGEWGFAGHIKFSNHAHLSAADPVDDQVPTAFESWDGSLNMAAKINESTRIRIMNTLFKADRVPRTDRIISGRDQLWIYDPQEQRLHGVRIENQNHNMFYEYLDAGVAWMRQTEGTKRISNGNPDRLSATLNRVDTLQINATLTKILDRIQLSYGFDFQNDRVESSGASTDIPSNTTTIEAGKFPNDGQYESLGLFALSTYKINPRHTLRAGLRHTNIDMEGSLAPPIGRVTRSNNKVTPSFSWTYGTGSQVFGLSASQGFRAPNLEDALSVGFSNRGFDAPNPDLQPEIVWNYEINTRFRSERIQTEATVFHGRFSRLVERVASTYQGSDSFEGEPVFIQDNVGQAETWGISLAAHLQPHERVSVKSDAAWTRGTQTDRNEPMTRIPPIRGNLNVLYARERLTLEAHAALASRQDRLSPGDRDDSRIPEGGTPGYAVLHLRAAYRLNKNINLLGAIENVTDKLYKTHGSGIYQPGRRVTLTLKASIP